jgi:hypothetical protein
MRHWKSSASLLLAAVIALSGCGRGVVSGPGSSRPPTVSDESGTLTLPQGTRVRPEQLSVYTNCGTATVTPDGRFSLPVNSEGSQLVVASGPDDEPALLRIRQFTQAFQLNSSTTAAALLMLLYPYILRDSPNDARRAYEVLRQQSFFAQVVQAVEAQLGQLGDIHANYLRARLAPYHEIPYDRIRKHELVASAVRQKRESGVTTKDIAKRLLDYGFHHPRSTSPSSWRRRS